MSNGSQGESPALQELSALADGELDASAVARACAAWRDDAGMRSRWHAYQLIGDVLRSEDLAAAGPHDAVFIAALRAKLADEPIVLAPEAASDVAPAAVPRMRTARRAWMAPSAVAAGFVLVAGALVVTRQPTPTAPSQVDAQTVAAAPTLPPVAALSSLSPQEASFVSRRSPIEGKMLRDARLERYLAAHQQFAGTTALGVPSGFLRNAAAEAPAR